MKKKLWHVCIILYVLLSVFITTCLLMYNEYNVTEFGNKILVMVENDTTGEFQKGDLIIATKNKDYKKDDYVFYYISREKNYFINYGLIESEKNDAVVINSDVIDKKEVIGTTKNAIVIPTVGSILSLLESKWGYLCVIILPILIAFLYEVYSIARELKGKK
ncbi:MAG: hypothetical protein MR598_00570 [Erysipelotrichaceae bacterium]|nr:hypothetical protein [Erysipelotrichaceae bacterium]